MAIKLVECEYSAPLQAITGLANYQAARILLRLRGRPLGWLHITADDTGCIQVESLQQAVADQQGWTLIREAAAGNLPSLTVALPPISVLIRIDDAGALPGCLAALAQLDYPDYELLIVGDQASNHIAGHRPVRHLQGASNHFSQACRQGVAAAEHDIIAITAATARPDRGWLQVLGRTFSDPKVAAVTGPVLPAELLSPAQIEAESQLWSIGMDFSYRQLTAGWLFASNLIAQNLALRRSLLEACGGLETQAQAGAAQELCARLSGSGHLCIHEPEALVWQQRPRSRIGQWRQAWAAGKDFAAHLRGQRQRRHVSCGEALHQAVRWGLAPAARAWRQQRQVPGGIFVMRILGLGLNWQAG